MPTGRRGAGGRPVPLLRLLHALLLLALPWPVLAQPYAADGGFDRPQRISHGQAREVAALALDMGRPVLVYVQGDRLLLLPLDVPAGEREAQQRQLDQGPQIRTVVAHGGLDLPLVAIWSSRDLQTGRFHYHWTGGGLLLESVQPLDLVPIATPSGPRVFVARGQGMAAVIEELGPSGRATTLFGSERRLVGLSGTVLGDGVQLTWLEGMTESSALGNRDDWSAYAAGQNPDGSWWGPMALGPASGAMAWTSTAPDGQGGVVRLYVDDQGTARSHVAEGTAAYHIIGDGRRLGPGRPVGSSVEADYVALGNSLLRHPRAGGEPVPVAWSPLTVQEATLVTDAGGHDFLAWSGTEVGGSYALYVGDDRQAIRLGWSDHLAAFFGWTPWNLAQEAFGQLAASGLAGVLVAMGFLPLLWLLSFPLLLQAPLPVARRRGALVGAALLPLVLVLVLLLGAPAAVVLPLVGGLPTLLVGTVLGLLVGWLAFRKRDMESLPAFLLSSATALGFGVAVVAFVAFQSWLQLALI